jgi:hypothetical protein
MLKRLHFTTIIFLSLSFSTIGSCQELVVGASIGYSTFSMGDLKELQNELLNQLPFDGKIVESFPGYLNYSINISLARPTLYYGIVLGRTSTGARISYSDYSGSYSLDQLAQMTYLGGTIAKKVNRNQKIDLYIGGQLLYYLNNLSFTEIIKLLPASSR